MARSVECLVLPDADAVAHVAAELLVRCARGAIRKRGRATIALSGGSTPRPLYELVASAEYDAAVPWESLHLLWGDERLVPPDDEASNFRMAEETGLLDRPLAGVHRMRGELPAAEAVARYRDVLAELWPGTLPTLDVSIQGMGEDGHTASLFPGEIEASERDAYVAATKEHAGHRRLTLTLPVLAASRLVLFLVVGDSKQAVLDRVVREGDVELPAGALSMSAQRVRWLVDRAAAGAAEGELRRASRDPGLNETPSTPPAC